MFLQFQWPEPGFVMPITAIPSAIPLTLAKSFPGVIELVSIFPTNFSIGPAPTQLTILEFFDTFAEILTFRHVFTAGGGDLVEDQWSRSGGGPGGGGSIGAYDRYYQIFTDVGSLDLRAIADYEDDIPGHTTFDWFDPIF